MVVEEFLAFIGDAPLVIHNASFDIKFINAELARTGHPPLSLARAIDTIEIAKRKIPGARYSLDELCKRFGVDLTARAKHGALLDAELTAQVYLELIGGRQRGLALAPAEIVAGAGRDEMRPAPGHGPQAWPPRISEVEIALHAAFVAKELGDDAIWNGRLRLDRGCGVWPALRHLAPDRARQNRSARSSGAACRRRAPHRRRCGGQRGTS